MIGMGFSSASIALVSIAEYSSVNGMGIALAPKALNESIYTGFCMTRSLSPDKSAIFATGCLLFVTWRKPFSQ